jgi:hypothetical protein
MAALERMETGIPSTVLKGVEQPAAIESSRGDLDDELMPHRRKTSTGYFAGASPKAPASPPTGPDHPRQYRLQPSDNTALVRYVAARHAVEHRRGSPPDGAG